jgi:hypothetical protein
LPRAPSDAVLVVPPRTIAWRVRELVISIAAPCLGLSHPKALCCRPTQVD